MRIRKARKEEGRRRARMEEEDSPPPPCRGGAKPHHEVVGGVLPVVPGLQEAHTAHESPHHADCTRHAGAAERAGIAGLIIIRSFVRSAVLLWPLDLAPAPLWPLTPGPLAPRPLAPRPRARVPRPLNREVKGVDGGGGGGAPRFEVRSMEVPITSIRGVKVPRFESTMRRGSKGPSIRSRPSSPLLLSSPLPLLRPSLRLLSRPSAGFSRLKHNGSRVVRPAAPSRGPSWAPAPRGVAIRAWAHPLPCGGSPVVGSPRRACRARSRRWVAPLLVPPPLG